MPTILQIGAFRVMIFPHDHHPAHVHVFGKGGIILFYLHCEQRRVSVRERTDINKADETRIAIALLENIDILCAAWRRFHGDR